MAATLEDLDNPARDELAKLAKELAENPDTRKDFLRMTRKIKPEMPIPELDIEDVIAKSSKDNSEKVNALEAKLMQRDAVDALAKRRKSLIDKGLVQSNEEIEEVEKLMLEKGMTNHETAAEYHNWMKQAAIPTSSGYNPSAVGKFDLTKYWKNPTGAARQEASNALKDLRAPRRPIGL